MVVNSGLDSQKSGGQQENDGRAGDPEPSLHVVFRAVRHDGSDAWRTTAAADAESRGVECPK